MWKTHLTHFIKVYYVVENFVDNFESYSQLSTVHKNDKEKIVKKQWKKQKL